MVLPARGGVDAGTPPSASAALERSDDGFELAEVDLELRGEGTILGARQKGRSDLSLASLRRDRDLVERGPAVAEALVGGGPARRPRLLADELRLSSARTRRSSCSRADAELPGADAAQGRCRVATVDPCG